jgi:hypothetical protein
MNHSTPLHPTNNTNPPSIKKKRRELKKARKNLFPAPSTPPRPTCNALPPSIKKQRADLKKISYRI